MKKDIGSDISNDYKKNFSINNVKFEPKHCNDIICGILNSYSKLYSENRIQIRYKKLGNEYNFFVYIHLDAIIDNEIKSLPTLLCSYSNIKAINLFSKYSMDTYLDEYDESKKNYLEKLKEHLDSVIVCYTLLGMNIKCETHDNMLKIVIEKPFKVAYGFNHEIFIKRFKYNDMITLKELDNLKKYSNKQIETIYKKYGEYYK